ncbi:dihydropteroate synthase-like protein [Aeropyrum camini]|uniref:dihydropteroate synthase-like protein n=1 Tax=Aeropyrum camini TaxID=229980 RepID=UPI00130E6D65|nr:dihydropteroate synthase-like protein [Aeropyrum camini]
MITSRSARRLVEDILRESGFEAEVIDLPVHAIGMLSARTIAKILASKKDLLDRARSADVLVIPGHVRGDAREISRVVGRPVYKGTVSPVYIPDIIGILSSGGKLDPERPAEEVVNLGDYASKIVVKEAFRVGRVRIPLRPPPMLVVAEIPPTASEREIPRLAARMEGDGASIVAVGTGFDDEPKVVYNKVRLALSALKEAPVIAETPTMDHASSALDAGASGVIVPIGLTVELTREKRLPGDAFIMVSGERPEELASAVGGLRSSGYHKIVVDVSLSPPPLGLLESLERLRRASGLLSVPLVFSAANVAEEVQADSHGVHALLALLALEAGASLYYVVEDSYKSYRSTAEAAEAVSYASAAKALLSARIPFTRLFVVKQPRKPPKPVHPEGERVSVGYIPPAMDNAGYAHIQVDHERGVIMLTFYPRGGEPVTFEGRKPTSLLRALTSRFPVSCEHAGYIGYELAKAEIALLLGKTYIQDSPVIVPVWGEPDEGGC